MRPRPPSDALRIARATLRNLGRTPDPETLGDAIGDAVEDAAQACEPGWELRHLHINLEPPERGSRWHIKAEYRRV